MARLRFFPSIMFASAVATFVVTNVLVEPAAEAINLRDLREWSVRKWLRKRTSPPVVSCSRVSPPQEPQEKVPTLIELGEAGVDVAAVMAATASSALVRLTSDEGVFAYLINDLKTRQKAVVLNIEVKKNQFSLDLEYHIKKSMYEELYRQTENKEPFPYAGYDISVKEYILKYLKSGKRIVIAIRFAPDVDPGESAAIFCPWLAQLMGPPFFVNIVGLTENPQAFDAWDDRASIPKINPAP
ncbi:MAG: hypothetical protein C5B49_07605 [Bdellovibrio sp.]|nr:MAG: hypothetical protein C5B49_07605 [Bdellovibrio sp.]